MPFRVKTSAHAERDLERIYCFIEGDTSDHAATWFKGLVDVIGTLVDMPQRFPVIREDPDSRHLLYGNKPHIYRIIYRIDESESIINILAVRHGARRAYKAPKSSIND
jgi:toxin ParE1/3/4